MQHAAIKNDEDGTSGLLHEASIFVADHTRCYAGPGRISRKANTRGSHMSHVTRGTLRQRGERIHKRRPVPAVRRRTCLNRQLGWYRIGTGLMLHNTSRVRNHRAAGLPAHQGPCRPTALLRRRIASDVTELLHNPHGSGTCDPVDQPNTIIAAQYANNSPSQHATCARSAEGGRR